MTKMNHSPPRAIWPIDHQRERLPFGGDQLRGDEADLARRQIKQARVYARADQISKLRGWELWRAEEAAVEEESKRFVA